MSIGDSNSTRQIYMGSIISYLLVFLNIGLGLIYTPWILREIGDSAYGLYTLAGSITAMFLMDFGMSAAITRFLAYYRAREDIKSESEIFTIIVKLYALIVCVIAVIFVVLYFNIDHIYANLTPSELTSFKVVYAITAIFVTICFPVNVCNGVLNAFEEYIALKVSDVFNKVGCVIVTIIVLQLHGGLYALVLIAGLFNLITFVYKMIAVYKKTRVVFLPHYFDKKRLQEIFSFSFWSTISSLAQQMIFNVMPTILAMISSTAVITMYGFTRVIEGYIATITGAINGLFLPRISRVIGESNDAHEVLPLMIRVGRINQSIILLMFLGFLFVGQDFVILWLGEDYSQLYICMLLMIAPYCISSSQQIATNSLIALNKIKYTAGINMVTGIINLCVVYLITPQFGVTGVCFSICLTFLLRIFLDNIVFVKVLKINIAKFFVECHIRLIPAIMLTLASAYLYTSKISICFGNKIAWSILIIKAFGVVVVFVALMWGLGWNKTEKQMFASMFKAMLSKLKK